MPNKLKSFAKSSTREVPEELKPAYERAFNQALDEYQNTRGYKNDPNATFDVLAADAAWKIITEQYYLDKKTGKWLPRQ